MSCKNIKMRSKVASQKPKLTEEFDQVEGDDTSWENRENKVDLLYRTKKASARQMFQLVCRNCWIKDKIFSSV